MDDKFRSRKFGLAAAAMCLTGLGLFTDKLTGSEFVSAISFILALYGASNVSEKYVSGRPAS